MSDLTAVCLFDGVGGFPYALAQAGIRTVVSCEIDNAARGVIADHYPDHWLHDDVRTLTADDCLAAGFVPDRGVLTAGFPCQDLSVAGRRAGLDGARSGLFFEIVRLADALRPRWLLLENVPGLLSACCPCPGDGTHDGCTALHPVTGGICGGGCMANHGGAMGAVLGALGELGYGFAWRVLDAQHFGVPQRRQRVVIVANLRDWAAPVEVLFEPESLRRDPQESGETGQGAPDDARGGAAGRRVGIDIARSLMSHGGNDKQDPSMMTYIPVVDSLTAGGGERGWRLGAEEAAGGQIVPFDLAQITHPENRANPQPGDPSQPLSATGQPHIAAIPLANRGRQDGAQLEVGEEGDPYFALRAGDGGSSRTPLIATVTHSLTAEGADASEDGTGRGTPLALMAVPVELRNATRTNVANRAGMGVGEDGDPTGTIGTTVPPAVGTATAVRRLTPKECERLQGFPDDWTATSNGKRQADSPRYRQMGNAIATPMFVWVARHLVSADLRGTR